jgi:hypothetical protein
LDKLPTFLLIRFLQGLQDKTVANWRARELFADWRDIDPGPNQHGSFILGLINQPAPKRAEKPTLALLHMGQAQFCHGRGLRHKRYIKGRVLFREGRLFLEDFSRRIVILFFS